MKNAKNIRRRPVQGFLGRWLPHLLGTALAAAPALAGAQTQIVRDGSLGTGPTTALTASGTVTSGGVTYNHIAIPESYGQRAGGNIFHSFGSFSIGAGDGAVFTIDSPAANVISRVTGGQASAINGLLALDPGGTGSQPNFFFINPAGVTFGVGAAVDVPGAFHVSTANYLKFPDGNFHADPALGSTLSMADPVAFGFLGSTRASIAIRDGAVVAPAYSQPVSAVGGDIEIDNGILLSEGGGHIRVVANGLTAQEVPLAGTLPAAYGNLDIRNGGQILSAADDTTHGGDIAVRAGTVAIDSGGSATETGILSYSGAPDGLDAGFIDVFATGDLTLTGGKAVITSDTYSGGAAGGVEVTAAGTLSVSDGAQISSDSQAGATGDAGYVLVGGATVVVDGGYISTDTHSDGNAGYVSVSGESVILRNGGWISSDSNAGATGHAGYVEVIGDSVSILGGNVSSDTYTVGDAGDVTVRGTSMVLDGGWISSDTYGDGDAGNVVVSGNDLILANGGYISSDTSSGGHAGSVTVAAAGGTLSLTGGSQISSTTAGAGFAGEVDASARTILVDGADSRIGAEATGASTSGQAGYVTVNATESITVANGGAISTGNDANPADPGAVDVSGVTVSAPTITVRDGGSITASTTGAVDAGYVLVNPLFDADGFPVFDQEGEPVMNLSGRVTVAGGGTIASTTSGGGAAGWVYVSGGTVQVDGADSSISAAVTADSTSGQAGFVSVAASDSILLSNGGVLSIRNDATLADGDSPIQTALVVTAPRITLKDAHITAASTGNVAASDIVIRATDRLYVDPSSISTSARDGDGGSITIDGGRLFWLDNSFVTTSVTGLMGNGGDISISTDALVLSTGFIQANTAAANASGGNVAINVNSLIPSGNSLLVGGSTPYQFQVGVPGFNVIQAAAPTGLSGAIQISTPALDISGSLSQLNAQMMDTGALARDLCNLSTGSSLTPVGRGGMPPLARDFIRPEFDR